MNTIKHYLVIKANPEKVYDAITTTSGLKGWWTVGAKAEEKVGGTNEFIFGEQYHIKMDITHLEKNRKVEWICTQGDKEWIDTTFTFKIESKDNNTILRFTHDRWREETDFFASCNYHWGYYMRSLKLLCETGKGTPFIDE